MASLKSTPRPDVAALKNDPRYRQVLELNFSEMIPFVLSNIKKKGPVSLIYTLVNTGMLMFILAYAVWGLTGSWFRWSLVLRQMVAGLIAGSILVIPLHELLHGLAYRLLGAREIRFGADLQQFIFFVTADRYPVSGNELHFLAMTPFAVINITIVSITLLFMPQWMLLSSFLLLSHNIMCIGDFAIVNYVLHAPNRLYTYDEPEHKKSYFFEEVSGSSDQTGSPDL